MLGVRDSTLRGQGWPVGTAGGRGYTGYRIDFFDKRIQNRVNRIEKRLEYWAVRM
jgi:hypothetical protein